MPSAVLRNTRVDVVMVVPALLNAAGTVDVDLGGNNSWGADSRCRRLQAPTLGVKVSTERFMPPDRLR